ncbi:Protein RAE1 [Zea mays]|uniref:Protein RAE1 n=1 Tax=Zea mays TaxID=4577 RepID=A0A3L6FGU2_MAIZE|nr:hypothetical protein Zm00014a_011521 [Zea mays]PWZ32456.1 Protein RAE1 [Zea mays]
MASFNPAGASAANHNPNKSFEVTPAPGDSVSSLSFSPKANHLVATSWDNQVRCWEVMAGGACQAKASISHDQPVLCSAWKDDGLTVFSGGCDKQVKMWPLLSGAQPTVFSGHEAPIKELAWVPQMNLLVSGSWDKTLRYWDIRQPQPVHVQQLPERCYALSLCYPLMVVGTADRNVIVFNLQNPQIGSIEGRVGVHHVEESQQGKNFTFKCHRDGNDIYAISSLNFHPVHGTFATTGSDGSFNFWDKDSKQRLKVVFPLILTYNFIMLIIGVHPPSHAAHSIRMALYLLTRYAMIGARVLRSIILLLQRQIYFYIVHSAVEWLEDSDVKGKPRAGKK